tara:strand:+ start:1778 stop:2437 length:660 start_codon:yes stop_codon:yes gene_type:complete
MNNLSKRVITSVILFSLLLLCLYSSIYLWILLLIVTSIIAFVEFNNLFKKIWKGKKEKVYFINFLSLCYLIFFVIAAFTLAKVKENILFIIFVCIFSDIGGYVVGKTIGGKKLIKISPKKTISGSIGSFLFSLIPIIIVTFVYYEKMQISITGIILLTLLMSFICQSGDIFISYFKRKAKVKDTGTILPGHGGLLDRIDGMLFVIPFIYLIYNYVLKYF